VAKIHKIGERVESRDRTSDKDALDVYRLLRAVSTEELAHRVRGLQDSTLSRDVTRVAIEQLPRLFGSPTAPGCQMATRSAALVVDAATLAASLVALTKDLLDALAGTAAGG